jgi:hypothetical protein
MGNPANGASMLLMLLVFRTKMRMEKLRSMAARTRHLVGSGHLKVADSPIQGGARKPRSLDD